MTRITPIRTAADHPAGAEAGEHLFAALFPGRPGAEIDASHDGLAIAAHSPALAVKLAQISAFVAGELGWCQRKDLRELAIQALNLHFASPYSFRTRRAYAEAAGVGAEMLAALPAWQSSPLFDAEQRLVIEYALAVAGNSVPDDLFARMIAQFGEAQVVECTALVSLWSFWALFLNATRPGE